MGPVGSFVKHQFSLLAPYLAGYRKEKYYMSGGKTGILIAQKVSDICESRGIPIKRFENEAGLSNGYLRKLRMGQTPSYDNLHKIADYFGVDTEFLTGAVSSFNKQNSGSSVRIPLLGKVAAGRPIEAIENVIGEEEIPSRLAESGDCFALLIKGDSMAPFICDGDRVIVKKQPEVENGEIAIVQVGAWDVVCKRFCYTSNGIVLVSLNAAYEPMVFLSEDVENAPVRVVGRVMEVRRAI